MVNKDVRQRSSPARSWGVVTLAAAVCACGATEGPLLVRMGAGQGGKGSSATPSLEPVVRANMSLQYQITGSLDEGVEADLFVIDLFDSSVEQVTALHAAKRVVIAYVSAGSFESWRADASQFPDRAIGDSLSAYPDESWLDVRDAGVRALMEARFDRAVQKGFDGLFASTLGAYRATSGFSLTRADELDYDGFLSVASHARGLSIGLSGDFELSSDLGGGFDWALAIGCIEQHYCDELSPLRARGLPVFDIESDGGDHDAICKQAATYGLPVTFKRSNYDAFRAVCPG
jgi:hypothetical protein